MFHMPGFDAFVVMLHDQGHIAAKLLAQNAAAALTIGTPILFSSVAHGSAHDIAGKGVADPAAMIEAVLRLAKAKQTAKGEPDASPMSYDVIVVGGGNAGCARRCPRASSGAKVLVLERAPEDKRGGNSAFTGGGFRMVHHGARTSKGRARPHRAGHRAAPTSANTPPSSISTTSAASRSTTSIPISPRRSCNESTDTVHWLHEPRRALPAELRPPGVQPSRAASSSSAAS